MVGFLILEPSLGPFTVCLVQVQCDRLCFILLNLIVSLRHLFSNQKQKGNRYWLEWIWVGTGRSRKRGIHIQSRWCELEKNPVFSKKKKKGFCILIKGWMNSLKARAHLANLPNSGKEAKNPSDPIKHWIQKLLLMWFKGGWVQLRLATARQRVQHGHFFLFDLSL